MRPVPNPDNAVDLELENHLAERVERLIEAGWDEEDARAEAHRLFGDLAAYRRELEAGHRERERRVDRRERLAQLWADLRYALRSLSRSPTFTAVVTLTLAIGIGANGAIFSVVDRVLLAPLPYEQAEDLVLIWGRPSDTDMRRPLSAPDVAFFNERAGGFDGFAFMNSTTDGAIGDESAAEHVRQARVSPDFFALLGVPMAVGTGFRSLLDSSGDEAAPAELVLSDGMWRRTFAADPGVVGRSVLLNGQVATVTGVLAPGFSLILPPEAGIATEVDVWISIAVPLESLQREEGRFVDQDSDNTGAVIGRLGRGTDLDASRSEMTRLASELRLEVPDYNTAGLEVDVRPLREDATAHVRGLLIALVGGVIAVVLVAWLNISTLLLARGRTRESEIAVRMALGADRMRISRQLGAELLVLVMAGGALAVVVAQAGTAVLAQRLPAGLGLFAGMGFSGRALLFTLGLGALTGVVLVGVTLAQLSFGGPAQIRGRLHRSRGRGGLRRALVVAEVAIAVALVVTSGLLVRSASALREIRPGFEAAGALSFSVSLRSPDAYRGPADRARLMRDIENSLAELPGVEAVGLVGRLPLAGRQWTQPYGLPGQAETEWAGQRADFRMITSGLFQAMGTRLMEGRAFTREEDLSEEHRVVIVDELMARHIAPTGSAVGATIGFPLDGNPVAARVVGVVEHVRNDDLTSDGRETLYVPYRQEASRDVSFVVRGTDPGELAPRVREAVSDIDPLIPLYGLRRLQSYVDDAMAPTRFLFSLLGSFGFLALLSAMVGLYGLIAYEVSRRTRDIGIRMAIGAGTGDVASEIMKEGLRLAVVGILGGGVLSAVGGRVLRGVVYGVGVADAATWTTVVGAVLAVTCLACWIPARRAARLDPTVALRSD